MKKFIYIFLLLIGLSNCKPEYNTQNCENPNLTFLINDNFTEGNNIDYDALILNEGGYTYGNASLNSWSASAVHAQNLFNSVNNYTIGDVLQSAYKTSDEIYLIVNNSQKIEVIDKYNLLRKRTITGFTSPRYMTIINQFALVTDLYANKITIFDTESHCEMDGIDMQGWTEHIFNINDKIYTIERSEVGAANQFANLVEIEFNTNNESYNFEIIQRIPVPIEPNSVIVDGFNNIWILSSGNENKQIYPVLSKFSTISNTIENSKTYNSFTSAPQRICSQPNYSSVNLYYSSQQKIYSLIENSALNDFISTELFTHSAQNLYSFTYITQNSSFLICDAKDYTSNGEILNYSATGSLIETIPAGVIPGFVLIK